MYWKQVLGYKPGNSRDNVKRKFRTLIKVEHANKGGTSTARAAAIIQAWREADAYFAAARRPRYTKSAYTPMDWTPTPSQAPSPMPAMGSTWQAYLAAGGRPATSRSRKYA